MAKKRLVFRYEVDEDGKTSHWKEVVNLIASIISIASLCWAVLHYVLN